LLRGNGAVGLDQNPDFAIRQYPEQAKAELSAKVAKSDVHLSPFRAGGETSGQPNFVADGCAINGLAPEKPQ
jgi:hypothetical protein